jgi:subtilisin family serine protease
MYRRLAVLLLVAGAYLLIAGCTGGGPEAPTAIVGGTVVDAGSGAPVPGVRIFAVEAGAGGGAIPIGTPEITSDGSGKFRIDNAPVGSVDLLIRPGLSLGYGQSTLRMTTRADDEHDVTIRMLPSSVTVTEITVDPDPLVLGSDQTLLFDATVVASDEKEYSPTWTVEGNIGTIDAEGNFRAGVAGEGFVRATLGSAADTSSVSVTECKIEIEPDYEPTTAQSNREYTVNDEGGVELLVHYHGAGARQDSWSAVSDAGGLVLRDLAIADAALAVVPPESLDRLLADPRIEAAEPNSPVHIRQAQPDQVAPWGILNVRANQAWGTGTGAIHVLPGRPTGAGVKVAIIDTGIDHEHPDLVVAGGHNVINPRAEPIDDNGHGTFAAGIIAARDNDIGIIGIAPEAELYAVKVLKSHGGGDIADVVTGIEWCIENGMSVINLSLGITSNSEAVKTACDAAWDNGEGAILCAAAGNNEPVVWPGNYGSVISVGGTDNSNQIGAFSSQGPPVELTAPGLDVFSAGLDGTYVRNTGTSFSAPHIAGAAALLFSTGRYSDAAHVRQHMRNTAEDLGEPGRDQTFGYGKLDVLAAYDSLGCADVLQD